MPKYLGEKGIDLIREIMDAAVEEGYFEEGYFTEHYGPEYYFYDYILCEECIPNNCKIIMVGDEDDYIIIFKWKDKYYKLSYYNCLSDLSKIYEVFPVTKVVIVYEEMKE